MAIVGYGSGVQQALGAADLLAEGGLDVTVADARFAKPLDTGLLAQLAAEHDLLVTVEEGVLAGGFGTGVWEALSEGGAGAAHPARRAARPLRDARRAQAAARRGGLHARADRRADPERGARSARVAGVGVARGGWPLPAPADTVPTPMARVRLDPLLAERGLYPSRTRAAAAVLAGEVHLGAGRRRAEKPGQLVAADVAVDVAAPPPYVSRGGIKLANALDALGLDVAGRRALDVGASTGGFTDCLLQRGAAHVVALDVAYGELALALRDDPRVTVLERVNARALDPALLPYRPDLVVADVSFISLTKVLPAVLRAAAERFDALVMVKPQFEVGRGRVGKGGVVRDPALRRAALVGVGRGRAGLPAPPCSGRHRRASPGPAGNRESFLWLAEAGRPGALADLAAAAARVEP